tara:strand:+ start:1242 stop:1415 length:174 start_codon:yes stop_codon:yes gene_type:complete
MKNIKLIREELYDVRRYLDSIEALANDLEGLEVENDYLKERILGLEQEIVRLNEHTP